MSFEVKFAGYNGLSAENFSNAYFRPQYNWTIDKIKDDAK